MPNPSNPGYQSSDSFSNSFETLSDTVAESSKNLKETIADTANKASEKGKELGRTAIDKIEQGRQSAASSLQSAASTLHEKADNLPGVERAGNIAHSTASKLESVAGYMRDHDTKQMMADVESVVKKHPAQSLLAAVAIGFLVGRAFRSE